MKEISKIIKKTEKVNFHFQMGNIMKVILKMIYIMEKDNIYGEKAVKNMLGNLKMEKLKEKEYLRMRMELFSEVIFLMNIKMVKGALNSLMEKNILEIG